MLEMKRSNHNAVIELREDYIYVSYVDLCVIELEDAKILSDIAIELCRGKAYPFITDVLGKTISISNEAREYFAKYPPLISIRTSHAILVNNMASKLLANFFIKFHKPTEATRVFTKFDEALTWIRSLSNN
jgi:hypothetical protein